MIHTLGVPGGIEVTVLELGATITRVRVPTPEGRLHDVALGLDDVAGYLDPGNPYLGASVGRYANRIAGAAFVLDGTTYTLDRNESHACLHGGTGGFHRRIWSAVRATETSVHLRLLSPDGDQGFPGALTVDATFSVTADTLTIHYHAATTAPTVVNLTNHVYLNLNEPEQPVYDHVLTIPAAEFIPVDRRGIPTGREELVAGTALDLRMATSLSLLRQPHEHPQLLRADGMDQSFLLEGAGLRPAARLEHPPSGRYVEVSTDQPSVHVYTLNTVKDVPLLRRGVQACKHGGVALETQIPPDAPNQEWLPTPVLRPGGAYTSTTAWRFGKFTTPAGQRNSFPASR